MDQSVEASLRRQLVDRRQRLASAISDVGEAGDLVHLMRQVDAALERMEARSYGRCEVCNGQIEDELLLANPMISYCLCDLSAEQQRLLEKDLGLASRIQSALLPKQDLNFAGWRAHYRYIPAGPVSGDYCDLVTRQGDEGNLFFLFGDVSGKGISAALLMAHLNAMFRSLIETGLAVDALVERANRLFSDSTSTSQYATLVCGKASSTGEIEVCNAGHCPPLVLRQGRVATLEATGFPIGIVGDGRYSIRGLRMDPGDTLFLYTDGLTEARDRNDVEYGQERLSRLLRDRATLPPAALAASCLADHASFLSGMPESDDLTVLAIGRT